MRRSSKPRKNAMVGGCSQGAFEFRRSVPLPPLCTYVVLPAGGARLCLPRHQSPPTGPSPVRGPCALYFFQLIRPRPPDNNQTFIRQHQVSTSPLHRDSGARARTHQVMNNSSMAGCTPALCLHVSCIWRSIVVMRSGQGDGEPLLHRQNSGRLPADLLKS